MATGNSASRELASWWKKFRKTTEKEDEKCRSLISLSMVAAIDWFR